MKTCPWSGARFAPFKIGGNEKVFASPTVKTEAHKAARQYTEHLIKAGFLSWEQLHAWYMEQQGETASCTTQAPYDPGPPATSAPEKVPDAA